MSQVKAQLLMLKGAITELEPEMQAKVQEYSQKLRDTYAQLEDEGAKQMAFALFAAEMAVEFGE